MYHILNSIPIKVDVYNIYQMAWINSHPNSKIHGANMGPIWGRLDPGGPHVGPMNFAIWAVIYPCNVRSCLFCNDIQMLFIFR